MKLRDNTDCPYLHDIFDQYCILFKGYKNCDKCDCEVLKILKENGQLKEQIEKMKNCDNCKNLIQCTNRKYEKMISGKITKIKVPCYWELAE